MKTLAYYLSRWTTADLLGEVVRRTVADAPALRLVERTIIRARLAESDRKFAEDKASPGLGSTTEGAAVLGTTEISFAGDARRGWQLPS